MAELSLEGAVAAAAPPLLVLLSGGRDSVCLLHLAARRHPVRRLRALHVNYGLRGAESEADEAHCRELCADLGVQLRVVRAPAVPTRGNLQAWARDVRYAAAVAERARWGAAARVAVAHTRSDQAETILYRLASSPSRRALLGMRPEDGVLVRPLLPFGRDAITAYCEEHGLAWREDSTNARADLARGAVRHGLLPALREVHPAAEENVVRAAALLRDEAAVLDDLVDAQVDDGEIPLARLRALRPALARLVVQRLADHAAGGLVPGAARRAGEIAELGPAGALDVGGGVRARVAGGILSFGRSEGRAAPRPRAER